MESQLACTGFVPHHADFWLTYWCATFERRLEELAETRSSARVTLVDYDRSCEQPQEMSTRLAGALELEDSEPLLVEAGRIRRPSSPYDAPRDVQPALLERARSIHDRLRAAAS
jgi:hypothetical protein